MGAKYPRSTERKSLHNVFFLNIGTQRDLILPQHLFPRITSITVNRGFRQFENGHAYRLSLTGMSSKGPEPLGAEDGLVILTRDCGIVMFPVTLKLAMRCRFCWPKQSDVI